MAVDQFYKARPAPGRRAVPISEEEQALRINLAAIYRLSAHFGWNDLIYTHISARLPEAHDHFLLNPVGIRFEEMKASDFIRIDSEGKLLDPTIHAIQTAGFFIHGAIHAVRPDVQCVLHSHTRAGMAVSALKEGLLPLTQSAMMFHGRIAYHESAGFAADFEECRRISEDMGQDNIVMILRNHGLLVTGSTVAETFTRMHFLNEACKAQVDILSCGRELVLPPKSIAEEIAEVSWRRNADGLSHSEMFVWPAMLRMLDEKDPSYRD